MNSTRRKYGEVREDGYICRGVIKFLNKATGEMELRERWLSPKAYVRWKENMLKWAKQNREKVNANSRRWRKANPEKERDRKLKWVQRNPKYLSQWRKANPEASARWHKANPERVRANIARWQKANPEKMKIYAARTRRNNPAAGTLNAANRRARKRKTAVHLTPVEKAISGALYGSAKRIAQCLGIPHHVDHIVPLSKGGPHHPANLQILPEKINLRKGAKLPTP